ncbi:MULTISPECIES: DUF4226 domain-containing protein [Mycobacterium]|uniref:DUF4226 domain-containing protein n=1 Tax=Mycobacterium TaxID=1763 RepID=UPI000694133D|nr:MULTISPECIES: DUF4226 domain-containing protein [Mycobacterium]MCV7034904.1 DUF4226 domain-containing protein [Mycobacterium heckeshornense]
MGLWERLIGGALLGPGAWLAMEGVKLFGHGGNGSDGSQRVNEILYGANGGPQPTQGPPPPPGGPGGLQDGADDAGTKYGQASTAVAGTDEKLAEALKQIFASNDEVRSKITGILSDIATKHKQIVDDPVLARDPAALKAFQQFVDTKLAEIQKILDDAKVDGKKQADLLAALGDEYRNTTGTQNGNGGDGGSSGGGGGEQGGSANDPGGDPGSGAGGPGAGSDGLVDPLAGMGMGMPGAGMGMDPLSMLGPALAGLGSIPGGLGGAGAGLPIEALGGLAPLASQLAGRGPGDGFSDEGAHDRDKHAEFVDDKDGAKDNAAEKKSEFSDEPAAKKNETGGQPDPGTARPAQQQSAPPAAVPASAAGDPARVVQMPDGSPVTSSSPQKAAAMRAVLNGSSVTDGLKSAGLDIPPPGTPITRPADPNHLDPGDIAQFKSREPVMWMGNGKIWLDGQLQPQSALPTGSDFLGWADPTQLGGSVAAPAPAAPAPPAAASAPAQPPSGT